MFELFKEAVRSAYLTKKKNGELPYDELEKPSPGDLRNLFLLLMAQGLSQHDQETLLRFFMYNGEYAELDTHIRKYDLDKFRPLRNYILGITSNPSEDVVKMLAILIDFQPRPYRQWREGYLAKSTVQTEKKENKNRLQQNLPSKPLTRSSNISVRNGLKLLVSLGILSTVAAVFIAKD
ncbi:hypothetical protein [Sphingobacterium paucimobilis]|uniref:Uncharacterized protein n=1 Tax=Sphingobacterium paucimobilis HER1398 TaxID=1346330 RepID=U2JB87_9SPHI|nr:hypothetical protein [Sphingobacterium paucimobilis]ERJ59933.1 hypothetical protein M472_14280 [Sphingobacterium paucimobilis HER1398]